MPDWRRVLIYTHRWLGIAGSLIFLMWFLSGIVMMYERMPRLTAEERLTRLSVLDLSRVRLSPADAARAARVSPDRVRVGMLGDRPVYRFDTGGIWSTVFADTGAIVTGLTLEDSRQIVARFMAVPPSTVRDDGRLLQTDQWTIDGGLARFLPMRRIALDDPAGTRLYVSERTGEPIMKTTARGRFWGYMGAVLHWTYFTPFRHQPLLWRYSIIIVALIGGVMCLVGLTIGIWRFSASKRFRLKGTRAHSPYAGLMCWHHYLGLSFGLFSFTWALSGALSLTPWDWVPSTSADSAQVAAVTGGSLQLDGLTVDALRAATAEIAKSFPPKEVEIRQFQGAPFVAAFRPAWPGARPVRSSPDATAFESSVLPIEQAMVWADAPERGVFTRFDDEAVVRSARAAMPGVAIEDETWLNAPDSYYYDRWAPKSLPVLRVRYLDAPRTWLYLDPQHGQIVLKEERLTRLNRWVYNGLHSWDLPFLYRRRPIWDLVVLALSLGGLALTVTTMLPAWRRLKRRTADWRARGRG